MEPRHSFTVGTTEFTVPVKYTLLKSLGKGAYGVVVSCEDHVTNTKVAIKKITPMCASKSDGKCTLRELRLMRGLGKHPNVTSLRDIVLDVKEDTCYVVMELYDTDLHKVIQSPQELGDAHLKHFLFQLLRGVHFLHSYNVLHRDLKPANLLVTKNCDLCISDFGRARMMPPGAGGLVDVGDQRPTERPTKMTEHVVTRWYRAPELMLSADGHYTPAIDMWSVGCILAELLGRSPIFGGADFMETLKLHIDVLGTRPDEELAFIRSQAALDFLADMPRKAAVPWRTIFPEASDKVLDLLDKMLQFSALKRITAADALAHPYFDSVRSQYPAEDPLLPTGPGGLNCAFESAELTVEDYLRLIEDEERSFRAEQLLHTRTGPAAGAAAVGAPAGGGGGGGGGGGVNAEDAGRLSAAAGAAERPPSLLLTHVFISHAQLTGGDQCMLLRDALVSQGLSVWYDQDRDPTAKGMTEGVLGAAVVLCFLSRGCLLRPAVQRELRVAADAMRDPRSDKRLVFVHEEGGEGGFSDGLGGALLSSIIEDGRDYLRGPNVKWRSKDDEESRPYLRQQDLRYLFPGGRPHDDAPLIPFRRGEHLDATLRAVCERVRAALPARCALPAPLPLPCFALPAPPRAAPDGLHLLLAAGAAGQRQLHYLAAAMRFRCPLLKAQLLPDDARGGGRVARALTTAALAARDAAASLRAMTRALGWTGATADLPVNVASLQQDASAIAEALMSRMTEELPVAAAEVAEVAAAAEASAVAFAGRADALLVLLTEDAFADPGVCAVLRYALEKGGPEKGGPQLLLLYEQDSQRGGPSQFDAFFALAPAHLLPAFDGTVARPFHRRVREREGMLHELFLEKLGAQLEA